jgi:KDO2-lipid IV(A) lauroyltransferase
MQFLVLSLPFSLDYFHSSLSHFLLAVRWRLSIILSFIGKKMVRANLALALPHLSDKSSNREKSYRHLCDMFMEMIKTMSISSKEMNKDL